MKKRGLMVPVLLCALLLSFILSFLSDTPVSAEEAPLFTFSASARSVSPGGAVSVTCTPTREDIGAFVLFADFDEDVVSSVKAELPEGMKADYVYTSNQGDRFALVYTGKDGGSLKEPFTLTFRTPRRAEFDTVTIDLSVTDAADITAQALLSAPQTERVEVPRAAGAAGNAKLLSPMPPVGTLSPEFDPEIVNYTLTVPFSVTSLAFDAQPAENCTVRVNRKNLGAGGSTVDFKFTVTDSNGMRTVYTVAVTRGEKATGTSGAGGSGKTGSSRGSADKVSEDGEILTETGVTAENIGTNGAVQVLYNTGNAQASRMDRLETAGIVLISVAFGLTLAVLVQRIFEKREPKEKKSGPRHGA